MPILAKPRVVEKFKSFLDYVRKNDGKIGTKQRGLDMNLNNACNLRCKHCFTNSPAGDHVKELLPIEKIADIANQADELGIFEWDLQGGELMLRPEMLFEVLEAIGTQRFYVYLTTNGTNMDAAMAEHLAAAGVNRVSVSIDSMEEAVHDSFRGKEGSWKQAIAALEHVKEAGMSPYLNITVGHYNAFSEDIEKLFEYSKLKGYTTLVNVATPAGMWQKMSEIMVDEADKAHLIELRKKYKNVLRNIWNPFNRNDEAILGCNTVNRLYITPLGDVLACPYVHIKLGNVFEQSLKEIADFGFSIKYFGEHSALCLAGEDKEFVGKYLQREGTSIFKPMDAREIFTKDDFRS
ncbi:MAG: radical SAM protein [Rhodospirillaceae bacterium]|nr:radical SAM protein [Rhodospirillales bacterium]